MTRLPWVDEWVRWVEPMEDTSLKTAALLIYFMSIHFSAKNIEHLAGGQGWGEHL